LPDTVARALGLGAIAGSRALAAPAALSRAVSDGRIDGLEDTPFAAIGSRGVSTALWIMEIGEFVVDKLPLAPSRTSLSPLLGRMASGAFVGAALFASQGRRTVTGGVLGATSALASAYAGERLRMQISKLTGLPDPVVALLEDSIAVLGSAYLLR
jgi:uncharacterized membrane protein